MAKIMDVLLLLLFVAGATSATKCDELTGTVVLTKDADFCEVVSFSGNAILGNIREPMTLDFSKADETTLNTFLAKFNKIQGAVIMDGNDQVTTLNLENIKTLQGELVPADGMFIVIRNNPKLANIVWNENLVVLAAPNIHAQVYNNPLLDANSLKKLNDEVTRQSMSNFYIQKTELNECQFEYPLNMATPDPSKYIAPSAEFLKNCKKIKGDFIVENVNLAGLGPFELGADACLRLVNVDMKDVKITAAANTGSETCKDGRKSEITGNPNVCGDELETLHKYYKDPAAVAVKMDNATCTMSCSSGQQSSLYIHCEPTTSPPPPTTAPPSTNFTIDPAAGAMVQRTSDTIPNSNDSPSDKMEPWVIGVIAVVCGLVLAAIITLAVLWCMNCLPCCRRHKDDPKKKKKNIANLENGVEARTPLNNNSSSNTGKTGSRDTMSGSQKDVSQKKKSKKSKEMSKESKKSKETKEMKKSKKSKEMSKESKKSKETKKEKVKSDEKLPQGKNDNADHNGTRPSASKETAAGKVTPKKKNDQQKTMTTPSETGTIEKKTQDNGMTEDHAETRETQSKENTESHEKVDEPRNIVAILESDGVPDVYRFTEDVARAVITAFEAVFYAPNGPQILMEAFYSMGYKGNRNGGLYRWDPQDKDLRRTLLSPKLLLRYETIPVVFETVVKVGKNEQCVSANSVTAVNRDYILAEAPMETTVDNFWLMAPEQEVKNIVMLCDFFERGDEKCYPYVPLELGGKKTFSDIEVECVEVTRISHDGYETAITKRKLRLTKTDGETWHVNHFHSTEWPDHGMPPIELEKELFIMQDLVTKDNGKLLVHCSAGVGRTGVFTLICMALDMLKSGQPVNFRELLHLLRTQRGSAVPRFTQFLRIYPMLVRKIIADGAVTGERLNGAIRLCEYMLDAEEAAAAIPSAVNVSAKAAAARNALFADVFARAVATRAARRAEEEAAAVERDDVGAREGNDL